MLFLSPAHFQFQTFDYFYQSRWISPQRRFPAYYGWWRTGEKLSAKEVHKQVRSVIKMGRSPRKNGIYSGAVFITNLSRLFLMEYLRGDFALYQRHESDMWQPEWHPALLFVFDRGQIINGPLDLLICFDYMEEFKRGEFVDGFKKKHMQLKKQSDTLPGTPEKEQCGTSALASDCAKTERAYFAADNIYTLY